MLFSNSVFGEVASAADQAAGEGADTKELDIGDEMGRKREEWIGNKINWEERKKLEERGMDGKRIGDVSRGGEE